MFVLKLRYEQQISELEQQLTAAVPGSEPWKSKCQSLEEKLRQVQDSHQETEKYLRDQIESVQQQLKTKVSRSFVEATPLTETLQLKNMSKRTVRDLSKRTAERKIFPLYKRNLS